MKASRFWLAYARKDEMLTGTLVLPRETAKRELVHGIRVVRSSGSPVVPSKISTRPLHCRRRCLTYPPPLAMVTRPSTANTAAAAMRIARTGKFPAILSPINTAGTFASIMPKVVPMTTG